MHDKKGEGATKFSVESVWKCQDLLISAQMTGRVKGNLIQCWIRNVRAFSPLHTWQEGWRGYKIQCWISLEVSEPPLLCTHNRKSGRGKTNSVLNQIWTSFESDLNHIWIRFESHLNQFWIRSESVLTQTLNVHPFCCRVLSITGKWSRSFRETFLWHLILALRRHILEKGNQIDPLFKIFQKMKFTFCWSSRPNKAQTDLLHLARSPKMAKTTLTLFQEYYS